MVGIRARFERILTPYASCDMSDHFLTGKTPGNAKFVKNQNNFAWCLELVIQGIEKKMGSFEGYRETSCSQTKPSGLAGHPPLDMVYVCTSFKWSQILQVGGNAHGRHPGQIWTISKIIRKLWHARPFMNFFARENSRKCKICRKLKQLGTVPLIGHISSWK